MTRQLFAALTIMLILIIPSAKPGFANGLHGLRATGVTVHARSSARTMSCSTYPCPGGYRWYYFSDPDCPGSPDSFEAYVEYWNSDASFAYDSDAGHSSYNCGVYGLRGQTLTSSGAYQDCIANSPWNCQDLGTSWNPHP